MSIRSLRLLCGIVLLSTACTSTRTITAEPHPTALGSYLVEHPNTDIRAVTHLGTSPWLRSTTLIGDSLVGYAGPDNPPDRRAYAVREVERMEARSTSAARTAAFTAGILALGTFVALILVGNDPVY